MFSLDKSSLSHWRNQSSLNWLLKTPGIKPAWPGLSRTESIWCIMMEQLGPAFWNPSQFSVYFLKWDHFQGRKSPIHYPQLEGCGVLALRSSVGHVLMFITVHKEYIYTNRLCHMPKHKQFSGSWSTDHLTLHGHQLAVSRSNGGSVRIMAFLSTRDYSSSCSIRDLFVLGSHRGWDFST